MQIKKPLKLETKPSLMNVNCNYVSLIYFVIITVVILKSCKI